MADQSDVENALAALVAAALYPRGPDAPSLPGPSCRVYRGWPNPAALDADLAMGHVNVTIFAGDAAPRLTTRFAEEFLSTPVTPTLQASVSGSSVAFTGSADPGQLAGVLVDGQPYVYRTLSNDTSALVAATIGSLIRATRIVHLHDATLDIYGAHTVAARVVAFRSVLQEIRRQRLRIRVSCWCPSPTSRDATAASIDAAFASTRFVTLADNSQAWLTFAGGAVFDQSENASLYRRDLRYAVEYATTLSQSQPEMLFGALGVNALHITA